jgi:hypothetical protein
MIQWRANVPFTVVFIFAVLVTAGATKLIYVITTISKLLALELPLVRLPPDILDAILGIALVFAGIALFKAHLRRTWVFQSLLVLTFLIELGEATRWEFNLNEQIGVSSQIFNWVGYLAAFILLFTTSARNYLTRAVRPPTHQ